MEELDQIFEKYPPHLTHFKWREGDGEQPERVFDITELSQAILDLISQATKAARIDELQRLDKVKKQDLDIYWNHRLASLTKEDL